MADNLRDLEQTKLPFGKFKGQPFDACDLTYLDWLNGQDWFQEKFVDLQEKLTAYLNHPTIARELERELDGE